MKEREIVDTKFSEKDRVNIGNIVKFFCQNPFRQYLTKNY